MAILLTHAPYPSAPPTTAPAAVGPLVIEATDAALTVRWTAPPSGGTPIGAYRVLLRDTSRNGNLFHPVGTTDGRTHYLDIVNLLNNDAYQLAVFVININAVGETPGQQWQPGCRS
ncbi:MAG: fibronectin type III domain-containing protein [Janthinobacterium lividum]